MYAAVFSTLLVNNIRFLPYSSVLRETVTMFVIHDIMSKIQYNMVQYILGEGSDVQIRVRAMYNISQLWVKVAFIEIYCFTNKKKKVMNH